MKKMRKQLFLLLLSFLILSFSSFCGQDYRTSKKLNNGWETGSLSEVNIDAALIEKLIADLRANDFPNTHAVLIIKDNKLVFEEYLNGYSKKRKQYTASVSKSVGSILTGIAIQEGVIEAIGSGVLDKPVYELFPKYKKLIIEDSSKSKILFRHVLSMTGGLLWDENSYPYNDSRNDWTAASTSRDPINYLLSKEMINQPGEVFIYNGGYSIMLSEQIQRLTGKSALKYAEAKLFKPLEISDYEWESLRCGLTDTDGGLHLLPRDMAKIGQLYLNKGSWAGKQIVSKDWIEESTKEQITSQGMPNYGFQWWCGNFFYKSKSAYTFFASGHGGQKIYVFPDFNAVIVITHQVFDNNSGETNNIKMLSNYILPSFDKNLLKAEKYVLSARDLKKFTGIYSDSNDNFEITIKNNELIVSRKRRPDMKLTPAAKNKFTSKILGGIEVQFKFNQKNNGSISGLEIFFSFREMKYSKN